MSSHHSCAYFRRIYSSNCGGNFVCPLSSDEMCPANARTCSTGKEIDSANLLHDWAEGVCLPLAQRLNVDGLIPESTANRLRELLRRLSTSCKKFLFRSIDGLTIALPQQLVNHVTSLQFGLHIRLDLQSFLPPAPHPHHRKLLPAPGLSPVAAL